MQGWLIYTKKAAQENKSYIDWFIAEGKRQRVDIKLIYREQLHIGLENGDIIILYDGKPVVLPNFVIVRTIEPIIQHTFESLSIPTFNRSEVAHIANHKSWTYNEISTLDIPVLPTYFTTKHALPVNPPLSYPFVVKEATGRGGKEVYYVTSEEKWQHVSELVQSNDLIIQDANVQLGKDLRVFVIGKEIIAAVLRKNENDFRANFTLGGTAHLYYLSAEERKLIEKIVHHFDFGLVGIDFLISHDGELIFNEIEDVVGSRILSATTEINLAEKYISFIKKTIEQ